MNALQLVSTAVFVIGTILVVLALLQDFAGLEFFSEPPYLVGAGTAGLGAAMLAGFKKRSLASASGQ
ncbi:MAG: hypothetical protein AAGI52_10800 [Bacteroidota bacterium]